MFKFKSIKVIDIYCGFLKNTYDCDSLIINYTALVMVMS